MAVMHDGRRPKETHSKQGQKTTKKTISLSKVQTFVHRIEQRGRAGETAAWYQS